jgi:hypothetical protein
LGIAGALPGQFSGVAEDSIEWAAIAGFRTAVTLAGAIASEMATP